MGKTIGSFGFKPSPWSTQDKFGADVKMIYLRSTNPRLNKGGLGLMNGSVYASLPLSESESAVRLVAEQNLGGFNPGPRHWYARIALSPEGKSQWAPQYILLGRFIPAFGLMTDEHRNYVRTLTGNNWNSGFDTGVSLSSNPIESLHYDLALMNGKKNSGQSLAQGNADRWGAVLNLRWMPTNWPLAVGASANWYGADDKSSAAQAQSIYGILSIQRWSDNKVPVTWSVEVARAEEWNSFFSGSFVSDPVYASVVAHTPAAALHSTLEYDLRPTITLQYMFDELRLNTKYPADAYQRHGAGARLRFADNAWLLVRWERALAGHQAERESKSGGSGKTGITDGVWAVLSLAL